jgi:hypothetical protein
MNLNHRSLLQVEQTATTELVVSPVGRDEIKSATNRLRVVATPVWT